MISISSNVTPGATVNPARGVAGWFNGCVQGLLRELLRWDKRRAAIKALQELDDRELRDIGLSRGQIEAAVCGLVRAEAELRRFG